MSRDITRKVLDLVGNDPVLTDAEGHTWAVVVCVRHGDCMSHVNATEVLHFNDGDDTPYLRESFNAYRDKIREAATPWVDTNGLRRRVAGENRLAWVWHGFLLPGNITLLSAAPKTGKTTLIFDAIESMLASRELLEKKTRAVDLLYVTEEADNLILHRIEEMASPVLSLNPRLHWLTRRPGMTWPQTVNDISLFAAEYPDSLVIIDTMGFWLQIENENNASEVRSAIQPLIDVVRDRNITILLIHHNKKGGGNYGEGVRGSNAFTGSVDIILELTRDDRGLTDPDDQRKNPKRRLYSLSRYGETPEDLTLLWVRGQRYRIASGDDITVLSDARMIERYPEVVEMLMEGEHSYREIAEATDVPKSVVGRVSQILAGQGGTGIKFRNG